MYHPKFKGNHYEMGKKFGEILLKEGITFPIDLNAFQLRFGEESKLIMEKYFPEINKEIQGVTDITGYDNKIFTSWLICMGCCLEMEENKSVEVRGCTAFAYTSGEDIYYARNNDLPPCLKKGSRSVYYQPENGNKFILNTSSFINGEEGINDKGLVVAMTFVCPNINEIKPGFSSLFLVRYILEKCKDVKEGIKALKTLPIASSCNILLADKDKDMVVVECNPEKINIRNAITSGNEKFVITVNSFIDENMWKYDASNRNIYNSQERYKTVNDYFYSNYSIDDDDIYNLLKGKYGFMCQYKKSINFETIWSTKININKLEMYRAEGDPRRAKFVLDKRLK